MGDLKEWIRLYRRAASTPTPTPTAEQRIPAPVQPPESAPQNPLGTLLPTVAMLRDVGIPLLVYTGVRRVLLVLVAREGYRRVRRARRR